ncbi:DUF998 domain-containing protein [Thermogladius sp. 4427co]|uniref:DUF998 domain-containing protein n=1 Tax=Thermogladius sp. 4427co TaxID=3450718 RepID=UPI003F78F21A
MKCYIYASLFTALLLAVVVIALSVEWFSFYSNALSDLGRMENGYIAVAFNGVVASSGIVMILFSQTKLLRLERFKRVLIGLAGFFLNLIGVYPEDYHSIHFYVSVVFFLLLIVYILLHAAWRSLKGYILSGLLIVSLALWIAHFTVRYPPGAAIPELFTLVSALATITLDSQYYCAYRR